MAGQATASVGTPSATPSCSDGTASLKHFDIVVANPPFSLEKWGFEGADADKFSRFRRGVPPRTKGDYAFILHDRDHEARHRPHGRRRASWRVVPWRSRGRIRQKLIEENLLDAVIGLPEETLLRHRYPAAVLVFPQEQDRRERAVHRRQPRLRGWQARTQRVLTCAHSDHDCHPAELVDVRRMPATREGPKLQKTAHLNIPRYVDTFEERPKST